MGNTLSCCASISSSPDEENVIPSEENVIPHEENVIPSEENVVLFPPHVDLDELISFIEKRLQAIGHIEEGASSSSSSSSSTSNVQPPPAASTVQYYADVLLQNVARRVDKHPSKILSGETRKALIEILRGVSQISWVVAGLGVVAYVLDKIDKISANKEECIQLLRYMCALAKRVEQLGSEIAPEKLSDVIVFIVNGCRFCISRMQHNNLSRFFSASMDAEELKSLQSELTRTYQDLTVDGVTEILNRIPKSLPPTQGQDPQAVGIEDERVQVIKLLNMEDKSSVRSVVLYGVGGIGKTTLATAVYTSLKLQDYKYCKINIQQDCSEFDLKRSQEQILKDLFAERIELRNCEEGRVHLDKLFREVTSQPIFLFIDNALRGSDLAKLLPKNLSCLPNGSRLLITTRKLNETQMIEECISCYSHNVNCLSKVASKQLLCLKALGSANKYFDKSMDIDGLVTICCGIPLVLEMVGSKLRKFRNNVSACESIIDDLKDTLMKGKGDLSEKLVDEVYETLEDDLYKNAFLDIATFFCNKDKEEVSFVVGVVALKALEDAALVRISKVGEKSSVNAEDVIVHDIIQARGRKLSERDRINDYESFQIALQDTQRLEKLKGIWLRAIYPDSPLDIQLGAKHLESMKTSLRILHIESRGYKLEGESNESFLINQEGSLSHCFGHLQSLRLLDFKGCSKLKRLPESFGNLSALKSLTLTGSGLICLPNSFGLLCRLEYLDLFKSEYLESLPPSFGQLSRLKKLSLYICRRLSRLPDGFGQLKSLTCLDMGECYSLQMVSNDFEQLSSLCALRASFCERLDGKAMEKVVEIKSLMFFKFWKSPMLIERWGQVKAAAHPLLVSTGRNNPFLDCLCSALFDKESKFLNNKDAGIYLGEWSGGEGEEVGFVLSMTDLCSPSNRAALDVVKEKIREMALEGVEMMYVGVGQSKEGINQTLMELPSGTRAFIAPDEKTNMLLGYSLWQLLDPRMHEITEIDFKYRTTVIGRARKCVNEEGAKSFSGFKWISKDVEAFIDIEGGFYRFFLRLSRMDEWIGR